MTARVTVDGWHSVHPIWLTGVSDGDGADACGVGRDGVAGGAGLTATVLGYHQTPLELAVYTAVCAGSALLPDLDCSGAVMKNRGGATVARTFGIVSLFIAEVVEKFALAVYRLHEDTPRRQAHQRAPHAHAHVALQHPARRRGRVAVESAGKPAVIGVLFFTFGLAVRGLMAEAARKSGWILVTALSACAAALAIMTLPADRGYPLLGLAVGAGGVIHTFGDMLTRHGCPVLWPIIWHPEALVGVRRARRPRGQGRRLVRARGAAARARRRRVRRRGVDSASRYAPSWTRRLPRRLRQWDCNPNPKDQA